MLGEQLGKLAAEDPQAIDLFVLLRQAERRATERPRIGKSRAARDDGVTLGQEPFVAFPSGNVAGVTRRAGRLHVTTRFLGYFGPQGALPLLSTLDAIDWQEAGDQSFLRFTEIFSNRFLQLFFRAFGDARAIVQADRPEADRFCRYLGAVAGFSEEAARTRQGPVAAARTGHAGLLAARVKGPAVLSQILSGVLGVRARIVERVPLRLTLEPAECTALGVNRSRLGEDTALGSRALSLADKIAIEIRAKSLADYRALLPRGARARLLGELVFLALGRRVETEIRLGLPAHLAPPICLGKAGELGWTGWIGQPRATDDRDPGEAAAACRFDARFVPGPPGPALPNPALSGPVPCGPAPPEPTPPGAASAEEAMS
ncbi:type VI secretion system baseplate subunit TssG [Jiella sonneratiae]|uniref:Type VI secretion system baseplate subunit TssG n=1 Tax=Jiella sonneratiae TaxID=2816856 RepID=A0ABS3J746_9HYPH|nr:type VI secretion system baseplate subunit TssG [Jiella sonneratiae]MBO0905477.1 type VI secretion system baseplate subunit TssG [Jiella sonneratiae]